MANLGGLPMVWASRVLRAQPGLRRPLLRSGFSTGPVRRGGGDAGWHYRGVAEKKSVGEFFERSSDYMLVAMWTWVGYGIATEYEHLLGHYEWPDRHAWTDAQLGIPEEGS